MFLGASRISKMRVRGATYAKMTLDYFHRLDSTDSMSQFQRKIRRVEKCFTRRIEEIRINFRQILEISVDYFVFLTTKIDKKNIKNTKGITKNKKCRIIG